MARFRRSFTLLIGMAGVASTTVSIAHAQELPVGVKARAVRRSEPVSIDGRLDEAAWAAAPRQSGFIQRFPVDLSKPAFDTHFSVLYDDRAIYVGVWADDPEPHLIKALLTRRDVDVMAADSVSVGIDSYHDRRTAYSFQLNAAGVQRDVLMFDDVSQDDTWDAVWTGNVAITPTGWTAEYRIPLNQLRFPRADAQRWGLQVTRLVGRTGEQDSWSPWPRSGPQVVSKFGIVEGIDNLQAGRRIELLPYATGGFDRMPIEAGDPLNDQYNLRRNIGLDLKYGLGSAFTVSATINPDFGQVEADPSKVNLSANELFFAEKRPFFLEGVDLFKLPIGNSDNSTEGAFYSRRIGAAPGEPDSDYDYIKQPNATTIYGAAKLTGKTRGGWSVGVLDAVTGQEKAETLLAATDPDPEMPGVPGRPPLREELVVAPLTNYAIARIKRDFRDGKTSVGVSATAVNRKLDDDRLAALIHDQAYTGGLQLQHRWANNAWTANISLLGSWVHGTPDAIAETQQSSRHYFQRPDASHVEFDPTRTSIAGMGVKWMVGQMGETEHWRYGFGGDLRSPGLELNDAGFQQNSDRVVPFLILQYRENTPGEHLLNWGASSDLFLISTFEPQVTIWGLESSAWTQLKNHWQIEGGLNIEKDRWTPSALRGGRALRVDPAIYAFGHVNTDTRKSVYFSLDARTGQNWTSGYRDFGADFGATIQARSNIDVFVGPGVYWRNEPLQYFDEVADTDDQPHYLFGRIHESALAMTVRANWTFSPKLTLQVYAQPFFASGRYTEIKDVDNPGAARYADRFHTFGAGEITRVDGAYQFSRNGASFSADRPDFNFRQLRSTAVLRWEYRPGSTVFAIWSHGRTSDALDDGRLRVGRDLGDLGSAASENIVMVKANYWFAL